MLAGKDLFSLIFSPGFAVNGINSVNIPAYERQFQLSSRQSSLASSVYDISAGLTVSRISVLMMYNSCTCSRFWPHRPYYFHDIETWSTVRFVPSLREF